MMGRLVSRVSSVKLDKPIYKSHSKSVDHCLIPLICSIQQQRGHKEIQVVCGVGPHKCVPRKIRLVVCCKHLVRGNGKHNKMDQPEESQFSIFTLSGAMVNTTKWINPKKANNLSTIAGMKLPFVIA